MNGLHITKMRETGTLEIYISLLSVDELIEVLRRTIDTEVMIIDMAESGSSTEQFEAYLESVEFPDVNPVYYSALGLSI